MVGPLSLYEDRLAAGTLRDDAAQRAGLDALQGIFDRLFAPARRRWWQLGRRRLAAAPSLYLHGPVGRGKSLVMDLFVEAAQEQGAGQVERVHFHAFMLKTHQRIHELQQAGERGDPLPTLAAEIAQRTRLLCFDEFVVNNIADAMILGRLFEALWAQGLTLIATSNFEPDRLYEDGLHRSRFLPFIEIIKQRMTLVEVAGPRDYRRLQLELAEVFFAPLNPASRAHFTNAYRRFALDQSGMPSALQVGSRTLSLPWVSGRIAMASFSDLCGRALGAADYLAMTQSYDLIALDRVPILTDDLRNEVSRFKVLIDTLYEAGTLLILRAQAPIDQLHPGQVSTEFSRTLSRLREMQGTAYVERAMKKLG